FRPTLSRSFGRQQSPNELDFRRLSPDVLSRKILGHITLRLPRNFGNFEVIPFLQNGTMFWHAAERSRSRRLTGKPMSVPVGILQVELRIAVPWDPDRASRNLGCSANGNEQ